MSCSEIRSKGRRGCSVIWTSQKMSPRRCLLNRIHFQYRHGTIFGSLGRYTRPMGSRSERCQALLIFLPARGCDGTGSKLFGKMNPPAAQRGVARGFSPSEVWPVALAIAVRVGVWLVLPGSRFASDEGGYFHAGVALLSTGEQDIFWPPVTGWLIAVAAWAFQTTEVRAIRLLWIAFDIGCLLVVRARARSPHRANHLARGHRTCEALDEVCHAWLRHLPTGSLVRTVYDIRDTRAPSGPAHRLSAYGSQCFMASLPRGRTAGRHAGTDAAEPAAAARVSAGRNGVSRLNATSASTRFDLRSHGFSRRWRRRRQELVGGWRTDGRTE